MRVSRAAVKDPRRIWKLVLGFLVAANLIALIVVYKPFGGSLSDLDRQLRALQDTARAEQVQLKQLRTRAAKVSGARGEQDQFIQTYFMDRRTTSSTILSEIDGAARKAGLTPREHTFVIEPVEGSMSISMMTVTGNFEGSYADLVEFVNLIDRSRRFLIIDSLQAAPLQKAGVLSSRLRMNTFIRDGASLTPAATPAASAAAAPGAQP